MILESLSTPSLLIDKTRLDANLRRMQDRAEANDVALRPHTKTHKSIDLARKQLDFGSRGIAVAKVGEAEVFAAAGFDDIRIAYLVIGDEKLARIARMLEKTRISFCVDSIEGARRASDYFAEHGLTAEVLVEVDCGYGRCGVFWDETQSVEFAKTVSAMPGLQLVGILTHAGHSYAGPKSDEETKEGALRRVSAEERDRMTEFAARLAEAGVPQARPDGNFEISIGSTPSMRYFENRSTRGFCVTEIRPGNYVFNDRIQVSLEVAEWTDCALTVQTTVISVHRNRDGSERIFLDAGKKVFTSDGAPLMEGFGTILYNSRTMDPLPHAMITGFSEEHGWVRVRGGSTLRIGDRVRVVPNHACVAVNTQKSLYVVDGDEIVDTWTVDAQSRVR